MTMRREAHAQAFNRANRDGAAMHVYVFADTPPTWYVVNDAERQGLPAGVEHVETVSPEATP